MILKIIPQEHAPQFLSFQQAHDTQVGHIGLLIGSIHSLLFDTRYTHILSKEGVM
jgi:hypothetical protein